jgi:methyltransferase
MGLSVYLYLALLLAVALLRFVELGISRRHQRSMLAQGAARVPEPNFKWMVAVHTAVLIGAALEVVLLKRPFLPVLGATMLGLFLASNLMRFWVVRTLGELWSVQVMDSTRLGVVTTGPFRYVRHPNYTGVILEMISLPLIHTAWLTALIASLGYSVVLSLRIRAEEQVLMANPQYRAAMGHKPRFLPGLF